MSSGQHCPQCKGEYGIEEPFCPKDLSELRRGPAPALDAEPNQPVVETSALAPVVRAESVQPAPGRSSAMRTRLDAPSPVSRIVVLLGGVQFPLNAGQRLVIGRDPSLVPAGAVASFDNVSRIHCSIHLDDGTVTVTDLGSSNGTFIDGAKLEANSPTVLPAGSTLQLAADVLVDIIR